MKKTYRVWQNHLNIPKDHPIRWKKYKSRTASQVIPSSQTYKTLISSLPIKYWPSDLNRTVKAQSSNHPRLSHGPHFLSSLHGSISSVHLPSCGHNHSPSSNVPRPINLNHLFNLISRQRYIPTSKVKARGLLPLRRRGPLNQDPWRRSKRTRFSWPSRP